METEVQVKQLRRLAGELESCEKKLAAEIAQLDALCAQLSSREIAKKLRGQSSFLKQQAESCKDMAAVIQRAVYLYEQAEEAVIQAAQADTRQYKETLRAVDLQDMAHIQVLLES